MKITIEIPEKLFNELKQFATSNDESLNDVLIEALKNFLHAAEDAKVPHWVSLYGAFQDCSEENKLITQVIEKEFSVVDEKQWA